MSEQAARKMAQILGEFSAAAKAVRELDARRASGENVEIFLHRQTWIVGPAAAMKEKP